MGNPESFQETEGTSCTSVSRAGKPTYPLWLNMDSSQFGALCDQQR